MNPLEKRHWACVVHVRADSWNICFPYCSRPLWLQQAADMLRCSAAQTSVMSVPEWMPCAAKHPILMQLEEESCNLLG